MSLQILLIPLYILFLGFYCYAGSFSEFDVSFKGDWEGVRIPKIFHKFDTSKFVVGPKDTFDFKECKKCDFLVDNGSTIPNSTPRDAFTILAVNSLVNLHPFIRTLRHTGSKCRIFIFSDRNALNRYPSQFYDEARKCGVEFIDIGRVYIPHYHSVFYLRYLVVNEFLRINQNLIDRVIMCDLFDSIIQHDPFTNLISPNKVYFSNEGYVISTDNFNTNSIKDAFREMTTNFRGYPITQTDLQHVLTCDILNGGLQAGGTDSFIKFTHEMRIIGNPDTLAAFGADQANLNLLVHSGKFNGKFDFSIIPGDTESLSTSGILIARTGLDTNYVHEIGKYYRNKFRPALVHQYDRSQRFKDSVKRSCPNVNPYLRDYVR